MARTPAREQKKLDKVPFWPRRAAYPKTRRGPEGAVLAKRSSVVIGAVLTKKTR